MMVSIFGALGGLVMTLPRLFYAGAADLATHARDAARPLFGLLAFVHRRTATPSAAIRAMITVPC